MAEQQERLLTVDDVAARLAVGPETVRRYLRKRELRGVFLGGRAGYRVRERDLDAFIDARTDGDHDGTPRSHDQESEG